MNPEQFKDAEQVSNKYENISETSKHCLWQCTDVYGAAEGIPFNTRLEVYDIVLNRINRETDFEKQHEALHVEYVGMLERILLNVRESLYRVDRKSQDKGVIV
jgi:hypothetical protein